MSGPGWKKLRKMLPDAGWKAYGSDLIDGKAAYYLSHGNQIDRYVFALFKDDSNKEVEFCYWSEDTLTKCFANRKYLTFDELKIVIEKEEKFSNFT